MEWNERNEIPFKILKINLATNLMLDRLGILN